MKIPPSIRTDILINHGYSRKEIREVSKEATIIRRSRIRSIETLHKDSMDEKVELMKRMLWKPFKSKKQREEERLMKEFYASKKEFYDYHSDLRDQLDGENGGGVVEGAEGENGDGESNKKSVNLVDLDTTKRTMNHRDRHRIPPRSKSDSDLSRNMKGDDYYVQHQENLSTHCGSSSDDMELLHHSNDQVRQQKNVLDPNCFVFHFRLWNILSVNMWIYFFDAYIYTQLYDDDEHNNAYLDNESIEDDNNNHEERKSSFLFSCLPEGIFLSTFFYPWGNHDESE